MGIPPSSPITSTSGWDEPTRRGNRGMRNQVLLSLPQCRPRPQRAATALRSRCCDQRCRRVARHIDDRLRDKRSGRCLTSQFCHVTRHLFYVPRTVPLLTNVTLAPCTAGVWHATDHHDSGQRVAVASVIELQLQLK